jgi:hypothetical protein
MVQVVRTQDHNRADSCIFVFAKFTRTRILKARRVGSQICCRPSIYCDVLSEGCRCHGIEQKSAINAFAIPENYRTAAISIFFELLSCLSELLLDGRAGAKAPDGFSCRITELLDLEETRLPVVLDPIVGLLLLSLGNSIPCELLTIKVISNVFSDSVASDIVALCSSADSFVIKYSVRWWLLRYSLSLARSLSVATLRAL